MPDQEIDNHRLFGTVVSKPIIYGSTSFYLGKKAEETKTHRWYIYVRSADGEDLSYMISRVSFTLHQSFSNPLRVLSSPPFEVSECGWGEFDCKIQIYFHDLTCPPVEVYHFLKLYPPINQPTTTKKPVIHEYYDELVFQSPSEVFYRTLMDGPETTAEHHLESSSSKPPSHPLEEYFPTYSELPDIQLLERARHWLGEELERMKHRLVMAEVEVGQRTDALERVSASASSCGATNHDHHSSSNSSSSSHPVEGKALDSAPDGSDDPIAAASAAGQVHTGSTDLEHNPTPASQS